MDPCVEIGELSQWRVPVKQRGARDRSSGIKLPYHHMSRIERGLGIFRCPTWVRFRVLPCLTINYFTRFSEKHNLCPRGA